MIDLKINSSFDGFHHIFKYESTKSPRTTAPLPPGPLAGPRPKDLLRLQHPYLKVSGHDSVASKNQIFVGTFPCIIPSDGVSDTFIACQTTDTGSDSDINNMPVTLISNQAAYSTPGWPNSVYFRGGNTPTLIELFPTSGIANSKINFYGVHRISNLGDGQRDMGDITKILIGSDLCSRFDIQQSAIDPNWYAYVNCTQSPLTEAGRYKVS